MAKLIDDEDGGSGKRSGAKKSGLGIQPADAEWTAVSVAPAAFTVPSRQPCRNSINSNSSCSVSLSGCNDLHDVQVLITGESAVGKSRYGLTGTWFMGLISGKSCFAFRQRPVR